MCSTSRVKPVAPRPSEHRRRADLDRPRAAIERIARIGRVERHGGGARRVPQQRLSARAIAQKIAVRTDQVGRTGMPAEKGYVEPLARQFVQQHMDQCKKESSVGLRLDRHPLRRARAGDRKVRLHLHTLHASGTRVGVAPDTDDSSRRLDIRAARDQIVAERRIGRDRERPVPQLAVQVLRVIALDALPRAETHVDRPPSREKRREGAHVGLRRAAAAEARSHARITRFVGKALGTQRIQARGDQLECLVPGDGHETRILVAPLLRIAALHRRQHAVRVVRLLHQAERFHAHLAAAGMHARRAEIRLDLGGHAVDDLDGEQIGPGNALVAVRWHAPDAVGRLVHASPAFFALAARRASVALTSTTKR
jgi:hypothetical protein